MVQRSGEAALRDPLVESEHRRHELEILFVLLIASRPALEKVFVERINHPAKRLRIATLLFPECHDHGIGPDRQELLGHGAILCQTVGAIPGVHSTHETDGMAFRQQSPEEDADEAGVPPQLFQRDVVGTLDLMLEFDPVGTVQ